MTITSRQVALLRYGQRQLGWSDAIWRVTLAELGGVESTKELDQAGFELIMAFLEHSGFRPAQAKGPDYGNRPGFASFAQLELIRTLWREWTRGEGTAAGLNPVEVCFDLVEPDLQGDASALPDGEGRTEGHRGLAPDEGPPGARGLTGGQASKGAARACAAPFA